MCQIEVGNFIYTQEGGSFLNSENISFCKNPHIYKITDLRNGKIYIGKTSGGSSYFSGGKLVNNILSKHGFSAFKREIIVFGDFNNSLLNELEKHYIRFFNSNDRKVGYNLTIGGEGTVGFSHSKETKEKMSESATGNKGFQGKTPWNKGKSLSEETRIKMSESKRGRKVSDEFRKKMSILKKGVVSPMKGRKLSEDHKKKISEAHKGKVMSEESKMKMSLSKKNDRNK